MTDLITSPFGPFTAAREVAARVDLTVGAESAKVGLLDLADQASLRAFAGAWGGKPLHILVGDAEVMAGGLYLEDCRQAPPFTPDVPFGGVMPHALDPEAAERLWDLSVKTTGVDV